MNIGIVTTWFERGTAYVSNTYKLLLERECHKVFIFARGGELHSSQCDAKWNDDCVTRSSTYIDTRINKRHITRWIKKNKIESILFNEQRDFRILIYIKKRFPQIKIGAYVDYYTEDTLEYYGLYDFLICNTHRHMKAMSRFKNKYYIEWGTDINVYKPSCVHNNVLTFFHSAGMASRKGTDILVEAFIKGKFFDKAKLIIHSQIPIDQLCPYTEQELKKYNIEVICKTVNPPGLYSLGDVYVYPARLDGLGLTMYEALSCGLPIIVPNYPPMNEVGSEEIVKLVDVEDYICRSDAYYYPMCICNINSLIEQMQWFVDNQACLAELKIAARKYAELHYDIYKKSEDVSNIFLVSKPKELNSVLINKVEKKYSIMNKLFSFLKNYRIICTFISKLKR